LIISRLLGGQAPQKSGVCYAGLLATVHLMLFATVIRLYSATTTRDYLFPDHDGLQQQCWPPAILTVDTVFSGLLLYFFLGLAVSTFVASGNVAKRTGSRPRGPMGKWYKPPRAELHNALGRDGRGDRASDRWWWGRSFF